MIWKDSAILLHIIALIILSGGAIGTIIMELTLWDVALSNTKASAILGKAYSNFPKFATTGALLLLISGINLIAANGWVYWGQSWLTVKLVLFVFLFFHPIFTVKPAGAKLGILLREESMKNSLEPTSEETIDQIKGYRKIFVRFHIIQFSVLLVLLFLATFKPVLF